MSARNWGLLSINEIKELNVRSCVIEIEFELDKSIEEQFAVAANQMLKSIVDEFELLDRDEE